MAPAANAETYTVNSLADDGDGSCATGSCTLRDAIQDANNHVNSPTATPDEINFASGLTGSIQLTHGSLDIFNDGVHINGPGADVLKVIGQSDDRVYKLYGFGTTPQDDYDVTIAGQTITGGHANGSYGEPSGGGIISTDNFTGCGGDLAALTLKGVHVVGNVANDGTGGGVAVMSTDRCSEKAGSPGAEEGDLNVINSTISDNTSSYQGGGIAMNPGAGSLFVSNSTIVDNNADFAGGGGISIYPYYLDSKIAIDNPYDYNVNNSTITGNDAGGNGGGIYVSSGDLGLRSTIVYGNTSTPPPEASKATTPSDLSTTNGAQINAGYSLIGTRTGATVVDTPGEPNLSSDPQLGALKNNGGPTPTELPATTSPAIDAGIANSLSADQRGLTRTVDRDPANVADGTDIGAVEVPADPVTPPDEPIILPAPATEICLGREVLLTKGDAADNILTGTGADDGILGAPGKDSIDGLGGDDCLFGQVGNDLVVGGPGDDNANGDRDDDVVKGDDGADSVRGQNGNDKVNGGAGDDPKVTGGAGDDNVKGGSGDDFVKGDGGNDTLDLGSGEDFVHSGGGADEIFAADGEKDDVICGTGKDVAHVDPKDNVDKDCNTVDAVK